MKINQVFDNYPPQGICKGFLSIPHSGEDIPKEFIDLLTSDQKARGRDVDYKTRELVDIEKLNQQGIHVIVAKIHRTCVDLNRSPELAVFAWEKNSFGEKLVLKQPSPEQKQSFLERYYLPYYHKIDEVLMKLHQSLGRVPVVDLHSMPSQATEYHLKVTPSQPQYRPSFCISNLKGASSSSQFIEHVASHLAKNYENISLNFPYYGGYLTQYMNRDFTDNIQIEIRRDLYMDEEKRELLPSHLTLKKHLTEAFVSLFTA